MKNNLSSEIEREWHEAFMTFANGKQGSKTTKSIVDRLFQSQKFSVFCSESEYQHRVHFCCTSDKKTELVRAVVHKYPRKEPGRKSGAWISKDRAVTWPESRITDFYQTFGFKAKMGMKINDWCDQSSENIDQLVDWLIHQASAKTIAPVYWLFNAEEHEPLGRSSLDVWIENGKAISANDRERYGEPLTKLKPGDWVLAYQNDVGIAAIGRIQKEWNRKGYKSKLVYKKRDYDEYRIDVDWKHDLRETPFDLGWTSPRFLCRLTKQELVTKIEQALFDLQQGHSPRIHASEACDFIPTNEDHREVVRRQIKERRGQSSFRKKILKQSESQCQMTGCQIIDIIEAAHINPYRGKKDNVPENGLALRSDIHTLFDLDLIGIEPDSLDIHCSEKIAKEYESQVKRKLVCPTGVSPSRLALETRYRRFLHRNR